MSHVACLPRSLKMKLVWLVAAFVVVWMNSPVDSFGGGDGLSARTPTVALASASHDGDLGVCRRRRRGIDSRSGADA